MLISEAQLTKIYAWGESKWKFNLDCEICGENQWALGGIIAGPPMDPDGGIHYQGPTVSMLVVVCKNCAKIRLFSAKHMGLIE
jgi:hypothetical protein